jgi:hypothetical protein
MLVWHYNYLILNLYHYLILVFTFEFVYGYALNIVNIPSFFCLIHSSTKKKQSGSVLFSLFNHTENRIALFYLTNTE